MFQFTALPMGLSSCPRDFTEVRKPVFVALDANLDIHVWAT